MKSVQNTNPATPFPPDRSSAGRGPLATSHYPLATLFCLLVLLAAGCPKSEPGPAAQPVARPLEGLKLRLTVVDDPALAAAVVRVQGEWNAQTGANLQVEQTTESDLLKAQTLPADALLCPSHLLGVLAERQLLAPVPPPILRDAEWGGTFELLRLREAAWAKQVMAVPFGSPVFCCYYRADLLEKLGRRPPRTWVEYQDLAKLLVAQKSQEKQNPKSPLPLGEGQGVRASWCGTIEPLGPGWAGLVLLARAAPYAKHRDNYSTLFDIETMEPLIASPPIVHALEQLVAAAKLGPADPLSYDPAAARAAFWNGHCGMALTWPTAANEGGKGKAEGLAASAASAAAGSAAGSAARSMNPPIRVGFVELPGSRRVFNLSGHLWDTRADDDDPRVPLLAIAGRLGVVNVKSPQVNAAFQLLAWLSDSRMSPQVCAASPATTLLRQSNLQSPGQWVEKPVSALAAVQYGDATAAALRHEQWLAALRLPGRAEYLAALDQSVAAAVRGQKAPLDALLQADKQWREITARLGLDRQRAAYRHSLGLEE
jgi:ABC-type glycerol-3-phosphate transport system substrate-binding protein